MKAELILDMGIVAGLFLQGNVCSGTVIDLISNKKHFMKNVKECRDVNRQKYQNKVGMLSSHITHTLDP